MKLNKINVKVRCDVGLCKNQATYELTSEGVLAKRKIYLCEDCAKTIYELLAKEFTPKSPINLINKSMKKQGEVLK